LVKEINVILLSGRTLQQGIGLEVGKTSKEYFDSVNYAEISFADSEKLDLKESTPIEIHTNHGNVVLNWRNSEGISSGSIFVPYGPWANQVFGEDTMCTGTCHYKGIRATLEPAKGKSVLTLPELVKKMKEGS
jgi:formylmethanofuran dehydrogenase subunit D